MKISLRTLTAHFGLIIFLALAGNPLGFCASRDSAEASSDSELSDYSNELNELDASSRGAISFRSGSSNFSLFLGYSRLVTPAIQLTSSIELAASTLKNTVNGLSTTTSSATFLVGPTFNFPVVEGIGEAFLILPQLSFTAVTDRISVSTFGASLILGKRFGLNEMVSYAPYVQASKTFNSADFNSDVRVVIVPLAFSFFF